MKLVKLGSPTVVMSNPLSKHNYFAWPTAVRLQNGRIAVVASGFRLRHICPFGKTVIAYSDDDGETYTAPAPVIDTVLDDRDGGITPFGSQGVIVTSFNNTTDMQRSYAKDDYSLAYLDTVTPEEQAEVLGSTFRISQDCGVTFGPLYKSPITSPHGPIELTDGTLLWVGRVFSPVDQASDRICAYRLDPSTGAMTYVGEIEQIERDGQEWMSCEPHAIQLSDGRILVHIRVDYKCEDRVLTIFQSESSDGGVTWSKPKQILARAGGAPPHLFRHSSGTLICTYGHRKGPFGIKAMLSRDEGKTWEIDHELWNDGVSWDLGYPSTIETKDGNLLTIFYAHLSEDEPAVILQQKWKIED
ncbi:MAG: exo-alpha-sialidase [Clostridia bacterium]|nr:exo-alpha-sialidase [Clostridia bacterium]